MSDAGISHQCSRGGAAGPDCGMYGGMSPVHVYRSTDIHFYCSPGWLVGSEKPAVMGGGCIGLGLLSAWLYAGGGPSSPVPWPIWGEFSPLRGRCRPGGRRFRCVRAISASMGDCGGAVVIPCHGQSLRGIGVGLGRDGCPLLSVLRLSLALHQGRSPLGLVS